MSKQEQIDKIAKWMGWHKEVCNVEDEGGFISHQEWYWLTADKQRVRGRFDPFTSPSDCARVMDEVVNRQMSWLQQGAGLSKKGLLFQCVLHSGGIWTSVQVSQKSWMEAFCLALLEAIGKE